MEYFVFLPKNGLGGKVGRAVHTRETAQERIDNCGHLPDNYKLYKLVPVSLIEEVITTTRKVIP